MSSVNDEEEEFDGIEATQRDTVSSRGYKRKRTSGAEAVMAEAMSVPEHLKKWRKIIGSGKRWRCHFWAVYNPRNEKDTGSEEKKLKLNSKYGHVYSNLVWVIPVLPNRLQQVMKMEWLLPICRLYTLLRNYFTCRKP